MNRRNQRFKLRELRVTYQGVAAPGRDRSTQPRDHLQLRSGPRSPNRCLCRAQGGATKCKIIEAYKDGVELAIDAGLKSHLLPSSSSASAAMVTGFLGQRNGPYLGRGLARPSGSSSQSTASEGAKGATSASQNAQEGTSRFSLSPGAR